MRSVAVTVPMVLAARLRLLASLWRRAVALVVLMVIRPVLAAALLLAMVVTLAVLAGILDRLVPRAVVVVPQAHTALAALAALAVR